MLTVLEISNPFDVRLDEMRRHALPDCLSPRAALLLLYPGFTEFEYPTLCLVNGEPTLRQQWDSPTKPHSTVSFVRLAAEPTTVAIVIAVVVIAVAVAVAVMVQPQNPAAIGAGDEDGQQRNGLSVYNLSGERNQNRLNSSIEACYGRNRLWPAYAARPYNTYDGNQQYQYSLFCLGHGHFKIESMQFEDSPITSFDDVEFEIVNPGETFDLFADNVFTAASVGNVELYGPNEPEFAGAVGPFVANPPFTLAHRLEVDVALPGGLYELDEENELIKEEVTATFQYQAIDDNGDAIGPWKPLVFTQRRIKTTVPSNDPDDIALGGDRAQRTQYTETTVPYFHKELATLTPQRFTLGAKVAPGRYQVKAQRNDSKNLDANASNTLRWESLRSYLPSVKKYGDVTLVAIKARATNNLNNNAGQRFNIIASRKLPVRRNGAWTAPVVTRNPVWAFCDIFRATYGGRLPDTFLDLVELATQASYYESKRVYFDYIFDTKSTIWEAARAVCRVGRSVPMLNGSQITLVRDQPRSTATQVFNAYNIIEGSFQWQIKLRNIEEHDGIEIEYMDSDTWKPETVLCLIGSDLGDNPKTIKLPGCSDRTRAYQEGLYMRALELFSTESISFKTGLEGYLPRYGDLVMVSHDVPRWGAGGYVRSIDGTTLHLSDPVTFAEGQTHRLILRKKDGSAYGPVTCTAGEDAYHVEVNPPIAELFYFDAVHEPPIYLFGVASEECKRCTVVGINPEGDDVVTIRCAAYDERVFTYEGATTPEKYAPPQRVIDPPRPVVISIRVVAIPGTTEFVQVSWPPALGARSYVLEQSEDAIHWSRVNALLSASFVDLRVKPGVLYLRVAGVNTDIGPWATWQGRVGPVATVPGTVLGLAVLQLAPGYVKVHWTALANTDSYELGVFNAITGKHLRSVSLYVLDYTYTLDMGDVDGLVGRTVKFRLKGKNIKGLSADAAVLTVTIPERPVVVSSITCDNSLITSDNSTIRADHS